MIPKAIDELRKGDIDALVVDATPEGRTLEYKERLPSKSDEEEFFRDVAAFANSGGGDIIYGVAEKRDANGTPTGLPDRAHGLADVNADAEQLRLENIVRTNMDPVVMGVRTTAIVGFLDGPVIVLRIPRSFLAPHMITQGGKGRTNSRFYMRSSSGKHPMDVHERRSTSSRLSILQ